MLSPQQPILGHHQVTQSTGHEQVMSILIQSPVAHFGKPEPPLNHAKLMFLLDPGPGICSGFQNALHPSTVGFDGPSIV